MKAVFLLSPAYCGGRRATFLLRQDSTLALAVKLQEGTLTLGEAFSFMSGLYFRGKLQYAQAFGRHAPPVMVITPTRGLLPPDALVTPSVLYEFAAVDVDAADDRYRAPLARSLERLGASFAPETRVVLLGSIATGKYVDVLTSALGDRLYFPAEFVGRGDMSRGGLLLRCVDAGIELNYTPLHPNVCRHGARPPKLTPLRGRGPTAKADSSKPDSASRQKPTAKSDSSKPGGAAHQRRNRKG